MKIKKQNDRQLELFPDDFNEKNNTSWFTRAINTLGISINGGWPDAFGNALHSTFQGKVITVVSLFSGAGGLDIGFHDAGFKILECNELVKLFADTLELNSRPGKRFEGTKIHCMDIRNFVPEAKNVDFVIGGPPCQTFSAAGARAAGVLGTDDERGNLFLEYARILKLLNPKGFLFENVYRIVGAQKGKPWEKIQQAFKELGYRLFWRIIDAADYGAPQFRERLIIVGLKNGSFLFPKPTHGPDSSDNRAYYTAGEAVSGIEGLHVQPGNGLSGRHGKLLVDIPPGLNYSFYTERMGHPHPIFAWRSKFSDYLYKADPNTPVRTIKAQGGQYTGPLSWENRYFTIEEYKRLQSFPDDYEIEGGRLKVIHQLGNSVPPQLARILAISVMNQVFGVEYPFKIEYLAENEKLGFRKRKADLTDIYAQKALKAIEIQQNGNLPSQMLSIACHGNAGIILRDDFSYLIVDKQNMNEDYWFTYKSDENGLNIDVYEKEKRPLEYKVKINIQQFYKSNNQNLFICINVHSSNANSLLATWKVLEYFMHEKYWKDDLVQVFGYYQYKKNYSIELSIEDHELSSLDFWIVTKRIMETDCVGRITTLPILIELLNVNITTQNLKNILIQLKEIGYEIRNHNTNSQIKENEYLIPYPFATLNERSLQRLTKL